MEQDRKIRVAITQGDTNGVGYEQILKTFSSPEMMELCTPIVYGSPKIATYHRKALNMEGGSFSIISSAEEAKDGRLNLLACFDDEVKVDLGVPTAESADAGFRALASALADAKKGLFDVLVTTPLLPPPLGRAGVGSPSSQQSFIEKELGTKAQSVVINSCQRMAFVTKAMALKEVVAAISKERVIEQATAFHHTIRRDLRVLNPRIAVLALNPVADGKEEQEIILPAIAEMEQNGTRVFGPYAAEQFFGNRLYDVFDGILAMYHDQGMAPLKALAADECIRLLSGLSLVVTAVDDNPLFEQAGKGVADESPLRQAVFTAIDVWRNRQTYDEPLANPLPKLYHEKRDESEKVRFSIPKKHENSIKERL